MLANFRMQDDSVNPVTLYHNPRCSKSRQALEDESLGRLPENVLHVI
jgi:hypothetical protein